jgi:serine/threonine-protein kinase
MPFTIEATINESSTTRVYRAFDETLHRRVLLKVLHKHLAHDEPIRQRFIREARACAALRSEYIVQVFDLTEVEGAPAIVMEYVEGKSLKELIADDTQRTFTLASKVALHVLRGLSVAHGQQIIHRDIKPGNIMVDVNGTIKVSDFGLARVAVSSTVTTDGTLVGTPAYIAPEQIRGEQPDARADLFSLGATLIETLSGERLFEGATYAECLNRVTSFRTDMLDRFVPSSSADFVEFVKRLMNPDKHQRFASADQALAALHNEQQIAPATSSAVSGMKRIRPYFIIAAIAIVLAAVYSVSSFVYRLPPQQTSPIAGAGTAGLDLDTSRNSAMTARPTETFLQESTAPRGAASLKERQPAKQLLNEHKSPVDSGSVKITSTPWAKVYVDNKLIGETPFDAPFVLASGTHTIVFTHPSFEPLIKTLTITRDKQVHIDCDFLKSAGFLSCTAKPWAEIYVDDIYRDTTPLEKSIMLSAGKHHVRFHNPAFLDIHQEITIVAYDTLGLSILFSR